MGIYSTIEITRADAIAEITRLLEAATDYEVCDALFALTREHGFDNYWIVK
jgi:hypothetical protein